ncbi:MAG: thiamine pyrophosphate-binding protein [Sphingomonadales bacterium]|nr:thiamine pyrophosphate-binding protein [Sphingomonadales bacterium]
MYERLLDLIQAEGINTLFGIPDPSFFGMFIEAEKRGMEIVSPHHEGAAALMADGYFRMTGKPAVLCVNKGPGVGNIAAGANFLRKENVPAVFIMAQRQRFYEQRVRRGKMQYMSQPPLFQAAMKYTGVIEYPEQTDEIFHEAFRQCATGVPGPSYVELPLGVMQAKFDKPVLPPHRYRLVRQRADDLSVREAVALLAGAKAPVLLLGQGVFVSRQHEAARVLAETLACPILVSNAVEAVLPGMEDRTHAYSSAAGTEIAGGADVVLAIGTELGEALNYGRGHAWKAGDAARKWIYVERDGTAIGVNRPIDVPLVGDLRDVIPQLNEALAGVSRTLPAADIARWKGIRDGVKQELTDRVPTANSPVHTGRLAIEATKHLPEDTILVRDGGASSMWFSALLQWTPRDAMWSSNWGAIGNGLPMAVGAQLGADKGRRVALLTGDSAFLFHITELETAVRKNLPLICIVAVDHAWGIEAASYKANFGDNTPTPEARWGDGVRLDLTAQSLGAHGEYVTSVDQIGPAMERALASGKPAVIHCEVDKAGNSTFAGIPGFLEFRNWFGEEGDFLGVPGSVPAPVAAAASGAGGSTENSSGY